MSKPDTAIVQNSDSMKFKHFLGDGLGAAIIFGMGSIVGMLTYFCTDMIGLSAGVIGTFLLLVRLLDALTDVTMGVIVDKTNTKWGKARPWLLWMAIPLAVTTTLMFAVPKGLSQGGKYAWIIIFYILSTCVFYTAVIIPYQTLINYLTKNKVEKNKIGIVRGVVSGVVGALIGAMLIPATEAAGGGQHGWVVVAGVFCGVGAIFLIICFLTAKERNIPDPAETTRYGLKEGAGYLFRNKYWVIMLLVNIIYGCNQVVINGSATIYFCQYILKNIGVISLVYMVSLVPMIILSPFMSKLFEKLGLVKCMRVFLLIGVVAALLRFFFGQSVPVMIVLTILTAVAMMPISFGKDVLVSFTADYGEYKFKKPMAGLVSSASSLGIKIGSALGAALPAWLLAAGGYQGMLETQSDSANLMIRVAFSILPLIAMALIAILLLRFDLEEKYPEIQAAVEKQRAEALSE